MGVVARNEGCFAFGLSSSVNCRGIRSGSFVPNAMSGRGFLFKKPTNELEEVITTGTWIGSQQFYLTIMIVREKWLRLSIHDPSTPKAIVNVKYRSKLPQCGAKGWISKPFQHPSFHLKCWAINVAGV
ncbi:hypothetical protein AVEN_93454-1 [Araneus ventricosus]|uniref:Uncharacterized protein n=1 Tax=Araneus ventricosus TaxID=182803 RepID=A0A4Y2AQZ1_ARAVE|nr:hypothetical protein AVEN_93454-1 [Araneus ventricosus]